MKDRNGKGEDPSQMMGNGGGGGGRGGRQVFVVNINFIPMVLMLAKV